jgi:hypothetical protein
LQSRELVGQEDSRCAFAGRVDLFPQARLPLGVFLDRGILGQLGHDLCYLHAERVLELGPRDGGVFEHVVEQRGGKELVVGALLQEQGRNRDRMTDPCVAHAPVALMSRAREEPRAIDEVGSPA